MVPDTFVAFELVPRCARKLPMDELCIVTRAGVGCDFQFSVPSQLLWINRMQVYLCTSVMLIGSKVS